MSSRHLFVHTSFVFLMLSALCSCGSEAESPTLTLQEALRADWKTVTYQVVSEMPADEKGGTIVLFLHGYGRDAELYSDLARGIANSHTRVVLPTAVLPHPSGEGAMWWEFVEPDWPKPYSDDPTANAWPKPSKQLPRTREAVLELLSEMRSRYEPEQIVLAGHSQGAMLALDSALSSGPFVDKIALLSGYLLLDSLTAVERERGKMPAVLISHGRDDSLVPFDAAERMRRVLEANGFSVVFRPHDGGHSISSEVIRDLRNFVPERSNRESYSLP